ncbi:hypothetical protein [Deinococcus hohokamensis]|uniref:Uncharacterized protein n=1 Tax=Deinococcus hohokamensis TaxID=309883 RepID=A0ABV9IC08_9DEIO
MLQALKFYVYALAFLVWTELCLVFYRVSGTRPSRRHPMKRPHRNRRGVFT